MDQDVTSSGAGNNRHSTLVGLIGEGISESRTPTMQEAEAARQGINLVYRLIDVGELEPKVPELTDLLRYARLFGFSGLNITYPYKRAMLPLLDEVSDVGRAVGAVNTVVIRGGRLTGHNTDYWGFRESFHTEMQGELRESVLLLGAGGAGGAVAQALMDVGVERLMIYDVEARRALELAENLARRFPDRDVEVVWDIENSAAHARGVVNATPVGMAKFPGTPMPVELLKPTHWVIDIIYFPFETEFLQAARQKGCKAINGSGMAVWQAVRAFKHFTEADADPDAMRNTFLSFEG